MVWTKRYYQNTEFILGCTWHECLTHLHLERPKEAGCFWKYFTYEGIFMKVFEGEMFIRSQTITLLQIFCEFMHYFKVIFKTMRVADVTF